MPQNEVKSLQETLLNQMNSSEIILKCQICGKQSLGSLISHITRKHKISMCDYRLQFGNCKVQQMSQKAIENNSIAQKKRLLNVENRKKFLEWRSFPSEIKHWTKKGFSEIEAKEKVIEFQREQSIKGNNEKTHIKRSLKYSGDKNPMSLTSISNRKGVTRSEASKLTPCFGRTGDKHPMFGRKHTDEALKKIGQHINHSGKSKIEHELSDTLISILGGEKNSPVSGWCCDYVNYENKLIVEFFGDFWHHNPKLYNIVHVNKITNRSSKQVWDRDARKLNELREQGYEVVVIWETEWRNSKDECIERIKNAYNRMQ